MKLKGPDMSEADQWRTLSLFVWIVVTMPMPKPNAPVGDIGNARLVCTLK